jgi:hypothetical protein
MSISRRKVIAIAAIILLMRRRRKRRMHCNRRMWRMPWNKRKQQQALNCNLLKELEVDDASYRRYIRMDPSHFKALSQLVAPIITRRNTNFQDSISVDERLAVTLRFLATGILKHYSILAIKVFTFCFTYRPT